MSVKKATIIVADMSCSACEKRIGKALAGMDGVSEARASLRGGRVEVEYDDSATSVAAMKSAIAKAGYTVANGSAPDGAIALGIGVTLAAAYMLANSAGLFSSIPAMDASLGYGMLFVVGMLTSVHCVAMCGGISLSQSVAKLQAVRGSGEASRGRPSDDRWAALAPGLMYNGGRVLSYTIVGGAVGALGSAISFSPAVKGGLAAAAGLFMALLGLKMLGLFSGLPHISRAIPAPLRKAAGRLRSTLGGRGPFAVGILNGLMPCGPLQTMQLYALGTGSLLAGALSMFIFSIGTVPLMLAFGVAAVFIPRKFVPSMVKVSAVLVMFLGIVTLGRAAALAGIALPEIPGLRSGLSRASEMADQVPPAPIVRVADLAELVKSTEPVRATLKDGVQSVLTDFGSSGYYLPFVVQAGVPLKWTIRVTASGLNGCNNPITVPSYGIKRILKPGDNLIEFTPKKEGTIVYSCWMGMVTSRITVVKELAGTISLRAGDEPILPELIALESGRRSAAN